MSKRGVGDRLRAALAKAGGLPDRDVHSVEVLIAAGEWSVALETLCTQVFEYDIEVTKTLRAELDALGAELGVNAPYLLGDPWATA